MQIQFGNYKQCIDISSQVNISPPLVDKELYAEWKIKDRECTKVEEEEYRNMLETIVEEAREIREAKEAKEAKL